MFLLIRFKIILQKQLLFQCRHNYEAASFYLVPYWRRNVVEFNIRAIFNNKTASFYL